MLAANPAATAPKQRISSSSFALRKQFRHQAPQSAIAAATSATPTTPFSVAICR